MKYFNFKFLTVLFALAMAIPLAVSAEEVTVCDGTSTTEYLPLYGYYFDEAQHNQMIYPASELGDLPSGARITSITFYPDRDIPSYLQGYDVNFSMANIDDGTVFETDAYGNASPLNVDVDLVATTTIDNNPWAITLADPFTYNGEDLLIDVLTPVGGYAYLYFTCKSFDKYYGYYSYGTTTKKGLKVLPKITITYEVGELDPYKAKVSPSSIDFGKTAPNNPLAQNVTVKNTGANAITPTVSGLAAPFSTTYTPTEIASGETVTIPVVFSPTTANTFNGTLHIGAVESEAIDFDVTLTGLAAYELTVCDGTTTNSHLPIYGLYVDEYIQNNQMIYPAEMLQSINGKKITSMTLYINNDGNKFATTATFSLKNLDANTPEYEITPVPIEGYTEVKTETVEKNSSLREWTITFDQPFVYNGGDLLLNVATTIGNYGSTYFYGVGQTTYQSYYTSGNTGKTRSNFLPKVTFGFEDSGETPVVNVDAPVFNPEDGTTFEENLTVSLTCATAGATIQYSYNGEYFTDYTEPITIDETTTIYAKAVLGTNESQVVQATYTKQAAPQPSTNEYVLVTDVADLAVGKHIIFVNKENAKAMSSTQNNNNRAATSITIDESNVATATEATEIFTLEQEQVEDAYYWLFKASKTPGYIYAAGANSNNYLRTEETADNKAQATIEIASNGEATVVFNLSGDNPRNILRHNSSSSLFSCYNSSGASGQKPVYIYVEKSDEPVVPELTVALDPAEKTYTVGEKAKIMVNVENGNEDTMVSYKINDGEDQDYDAETGIVLPNDKAKGYTVSVYATDGEREATATGTYSFTAAPAFDITLTPNKEGNYTVGDNAVVTVAVDKYIGEDYLVTYTIGDSDEQIEYNAQTGIVLPNDKAGDVTVTVYVTDGYEHAGDEFVSATYHFDAAPDIVVTLNPAGGNYYLGEQVKVTVTAQNTIGDYEVTYQIGDGEEFDYEDGITIPSDQEGTVDLTVTVVDGYHDGAATATGAYTFAPRPVVAMPTLSLVGGTYGEAQQLTITAEDGATILYSTDGSEPTTVYTDAIALGEGTTTVKAIATLDGYTNSPVATATYIIEIPAELPDVPVMKGYFQIKNNGNNKYANIAGRKTLNFTDEPADKAGTVIWLETNSKGQVQSLRSQAADLQGYANRAMRYVPDIVELVVDKLNAEGAGEILGEHGLDEIMEKFNECFDYHLYVEEADGGYRLYGKTPSMQPVVDFYREHTHQVETKLPKLEQFINDALAKLREKIGGNSVFTEFSLHQIWENMGGTLTEPVDDESTMAFYREVLNNKNYVWDFAYQTAMIYVNNVKNHPRWEEVEAQLGEFAQYIDMIEQVRPDFKYYVVQENDKPDFISEGNRDIINNAARTLWTLEERTTFTVNLPESTASTCKMYSNATTLYTDFAYTLPEGVTALKVIAVDENGNAQTEALSGVIPAQTPVMLTGVEPGEKVLTLSTEAGTAVTGNLLVGPDYLINTYKLTTPQIEGIFNMVKDKLGQSFYDTYVAQYEHLMYLNSGTVNNKYFWGLSQSDVEKCIYDLDGTEDCVVRNLSGNQFINNWEVKTNKAFLVSDVHDVITLNVINHDVNHDGSVNATDITDLIDFMLGIDGPACPFCSDINEDGRVDAQDLTDLIDYLLSDPNYHPVDPDEGD